jgi:hypothetical protein
VRIFWSNPLVGSIVTLGFIILCWPLVNKVMDRKRSREPRAKSASLTG